MIFNCFAQEFKYENLKTDSIYFKTQFIDLNKQGFYADKLRAFGATIEKKAKIIKVLIDTMPLIYQYLNDSVQELSKNIREEFVGCYNKKINLSRLLINNSNSVTNHYKVLVTFTGRFDHFNFHNREFVIAHAEESHAPG